MKVKERERVREREKEKDERKIQNDEESNIISYHIISWHIGE